MGIENERERTSSMLDCKHNVLKEIWHQMIGKEDPVKTPGILGLISQRKKHLMAEEK